MFRKQISPKVTAVAVLLILAGIQFVYWRLLVYRPPGGAPGGGGGGGAVQAVAYATGRADVEVLTVAGDGAGYRDGAVWEARFCGPNALTLGPGGVLYVADSRNHRVRAVSPDGKVSTIAGGGEPDGDGGRADGDALSARFSYPSGVAVGADSTVYISDTGNHRICRVRQGQVTTLAGGSAGNLDGAGTSARFRFPAALALDDAGALWVADAGNHQVRKIDTAGQVSTPKETPEAIRLRLGEVSAPREHAALFASADGQREPEATSFTVGRRSASASILPDTKLFVDTEYRVLMLSRKNEPDFLLAGRRSAGEVKWANTDGDGRRAAFVMPCAIAPSPDGNVYVADYAANVIRKVILPEWVRRGEAVPVARRRGQWRVRSGS